MARPLRDAGGEEPDQPPRTSDGVVASDWPPSEGGGSGPAYTARDADPAALSLYVHLPWWCASARTATSIRTGAACRRSTPTSMRCWPISTTTLAARMGTHDPQCLLRRRHGLFPPTRSTASQGASARLALAPGHAGNQSAPPAALRGLPQGRHEERVSFDVKVSTTAACTASAASTTARRPMRR